MLRKIEDVVLHVTSEDGRAIFFALRDSTGEFWELCVNTETGSMKATPVKLSQKSIDAVG